MTTENINLNKNLKTYRLNIPEYQKMCELLGREPKAIEWPLFSALWSEHCSYKSSRIHLKKFAKTINQKVISSQGENAGILDLGYGEKIAFKMESHNHPSFIEPYQGAATGVGGILRDIFTMGAKPIALCDYLCFGEPEAERMPKLIDGVIRGIGGYGNCVGVPTINGRTHFDKKYNKNILVNAMAVGLIKEGEPIALSGASGVGNWVVYVGAKTGRDGVHGAAMASESFDDNSDSKKPNVQIGDPYFEKLLIESCREVIKENLVVAIQDMGAAGLTSSSFEMAAKGNVGMKMDLSKVPLREDNMGPEEILLSESQERMLLVCLPSNFNKLQTIFNRWGLEAAHLGEITKDRVVSLWWKGECLTEVDPLLLTDHAPIYDRPFQKWTSPNKKETFDALSSNVLLNDSKLNHQSDFNLTEKIKSPNFCSKSWIYHQYDQRVQARTVRGAESDVAFHRLDSGRGLAITVGCRPWLMEIDAELGAYDAVFYPSFQMALKGALVQGITDCLNFGNPEKPQIMSEFVASVEAIANASLALSAPVISGNVSFYNETLGENIISTPATGLVGLRPEVEEIPFDGFQNLSNSVWIIDFGSTQVDRSKNQFVGEISLELWSKQIVDISNYVAKQKVRDIPSVQMSGSGGLLLSLGKMCQNSLGIGISANFTAEELSRIHLYQGIFEVNPEFEVQFVKDMELLGFKIRQLGVVIPEKITWKNHSWSVSELMHVWMNGFGGMLAGIS